MRFFHLNVGHVSRSTGRSAVQNIAYITGEILYETRRELQADYPNNRGISTWATLAPLGSGIAEDDLSWWDKLETFEDAYARQRFKNPDTLEKYLRHARVAQTYVAALPKELTQEQNEALVRETTHERFASKGLLATYAINWDEGNPHAHITVSTRTVWNGKISWDKSVSRSLVTPSGLRETRRLFAETINKHQELAGIPDRVDHRSYAELGIDLIPTRHKGWYAHQLERQGLPSRNGMGNAFIAEENKQRIGEFPSIILQELTSKQATFSATDVTRLVQQRLKDDMGDIAPYVIHAVMKESVSVGIGFDDQMRYTSKAYKEREDQVLASLEMYKEQTVSLPINQEHIETHLKGEASWLDEGQKEAVRTLCQDAQFSVLVGRAGTGKTTALQSVVKLHQEAGYMVLGMTPSATAAHELSKGAGCVSDTIAHYAHHWKPYLELCQKTQQATTEDERSYYRILANACKDALQAKAMAAKHAPDQKTLILVDEIGMVGIGRAWGSREQGQACPREGGGNKGTGTGPGSSSIAGGWHFLTEVVSATGAKLIVVGDDHQNKPVEAGDVLPKVIRDFKDSGHLCFLTEIQRQQVPWMRDASQAFAELRTVEALGMYESQGHIQNYETQGDVYQEMARQYLQKRLAQPDANVLAMAYTNEEVLDLNRAIRAILKENGLLPKDDLLIRGGAKDQGGQKKGQERQKEGQRESGGNGGGRDDGYTIGDKIVFTQNDRGFWTKFKSPDSSFFVRNGMQGTIESITPCVVKDRETDKPCNTHRISVRVEEGVKPLGEKESKQQSSDDHPPIVHFYLKDYAHFQHGYAVTIHKSQGATVDQSLVKLSPLMDAFLLYVAATRHRHDMTAYYSQEDFADFATLLSKLGKVPYKDLAADYSVLEEHQEFWMNVQEYKALGFELLSVRTFAEHASKRNSGPSSQNGILQEEGKPNGTSQRSQGQGLEEKTEQEQEQNLKQGEPQNPDAASQKNRTEEAWATVRALQEERKSLAKIILEDWDVHQDFARQAGIPLESLKIAAGLMKRPLSRREAQVQAVAEQYASVAMETRQLWWDIRRTHPGARAKTHPQWNTFEALRDQRGALAAQVIQAPGLYKPFLRDIAKAFEKVEGRRPEEAIGRFGYGLSIIKAQAEAYQARKRQEDMLAKATDPMLSEQLQILLGYIEARDMCASFWQGLKPKLDALKGTLLSDAICQEIDEWRDMRMTRNQHALKIVDDWEDYGPLIQRLRIRLVSGADTFGTLMEQKEQAVRESLVNTYTAAPENPPIQGSPSTEGIYINGLPIGNKERFQAAFQLKDMMEEEKAAGKKTTVSELYFRGLNPRDISRDARIYQNFKLLETLEAEAEREACRLYITYDYHTLIAKGLYRQCIADHEKADAKSSAKVSESPHFPAYQEAARERNAAAMALCIHPAFLETLAMLEQKGLEINRDQIIDHGKDGYRTKVVAQYRILGFDGEPQSDMRRAETANLLMTMVEDDRKVGSKGTLIAIYQAGFDPKDVALAAEHYRYFTVLASLNKEDQEAFGQVAGYRMACGRADVLYKQCAKEVETTDIKVHDHPFYPEYLKVVSERNHRAMDLLGREDWDDCWELAYSCGIILNEDEVIEHSQGAIREQLITQYLKTDSTLVKLLIARDLKATMDQDEKDEWKSTVADLYRHKVSPQTIRAEARQFDRMAAYALLKDEEDKKLYDLLAHYDDLHLESKRHYGTAFKEAEEQGLKKEQTTSYGLFQETLKERQELAHQIHHTAKPTIIESMARDMGLPLKALENDLRHYEVGLAKKAILPGSVTPLEMKPDTQIKPPLEQTTPQPQVEEAIKAGIKEKNTKEARHTQSVVPEQKTEARVDIESKSKSKSKPKTEPKSKPDTKSDVDDITQAAKVFVSLTEQYQKTHWQDPERTKIRESLDKLVAKHWQDERFVAQIENSSSKLAAARIRPEIHLAQTEFSRNQNIIDRSADGSIDIRFSPSPGQTPPTDPNVVTQAAKAFVSLTEQYQKTHWQDSERAKIRESLDKLVARHWQDERFVSQIETSGSEFAASKIKVEIHLAQTELSRSRDQLDR